MPLKKTQSTLNMRYAFQRHQMTSRWDPGAFPPSQPTPSLFTPSPLHLQAATHSLRPAPLPQRNLIPMTIPFFHLPREVRDMIYDYYWTSHPGLKPSWTPFAPLLLQLRYQGTYAMDDDTPGCTTQDKDSQPAAYPTWLLASKQLLREALAQFTSTAAWLYDPSQRSPAWHDGAATLLDTDNVRTVILHMESLAAYEHPPRTNDGIAPETGLRPYATALAAEQARRKALGQDAGIQRVRVCGWTPLMPVYGECRQAVHIARAVERVFAGTELEVLEVEVYRRGRGKRRRVLYESVYSGGLRFADRGAYMAHMDVLDRSGAFLRDW
ncbi:hypothetical protein IQ07DRAFT_276446 [Pyrenochaeta sp. DS3sAY3a]|nr:hypothetical protein IQ07DRAFT_276446 [Pyrenochaeta sp. DS3sAY3a]